MPKPVINLDQLDLVADEDGPFASRYGVISDAIGAVRLGYNLTIVPPGKKACPFHNHRVGEEMFLVLEGEGLLRFGDATYPLRKHDVVACPPGGRDAAHQIINTGATELRYLALGTRDVTEVCEYPDSDKIGVYCGRVGARDLRLAFRAPQAVDYMDGETR
jgi:uncharacterized cupin superfamily protein